MKNNSSHGSFWPSYVDIMASLFAVMLVLFVVSYGHFKVSDSRLQKFKDKYEEIESIYNAVENIDTNFFEYNAEYVKHIFKIQVTYQKQKFKLDQLQADLNNKEKANQLRNSIIAAGEEIKRTIENLQESEKTNQNIKYFVVLEGQASDDNYNNDDYYNNDVLSYQRALFLNRFWKSHGLDFSKMPRCELVISGSGVAGVPRDTTNETNNQRFLIHIVPVIGNIHTERLN